MKGRFGKSYGPQGKAVSGNYSCLSHAPVGAFDILAQQAMVKITGLSDSLPSKEAMAAMPSPHVTAMAYALTAPHDDDAEGLVNDLLEAGLTLDEVCFDHLGPAACELGEMWDQDRLPFTEVALATVRLQALLRTLPRVISAMPSLPERGAVFAAVPGEAHTVGVMMAAEYFRRKGWDVTLFLAMEERELVARVADDDRQIVGLSCSSLQSRPALRALVSALRAARPELRIVLSGYLAEHEGVRPHLPRFDAIVRSTQGSEAVLEALITPQSDCVVSTLSLRMGSDA